MIEISPVTNRSDLLLQSISNYAIHMLDADGTVSSWNYGAKRLKGYASAEIIVEHFSRFYAEDDRSGGLPDRALATALAEGRFEAEGWRFRKDGTRFWANAVIEPILDEFGKHIGFAKITRDLSERKAAEEALRESEERFRLLVQGVTDYAIYMLDPQGHVSSWNAGAERFKGYIAEEILGQHISRFYTSEERDAGVPAMALETAATEGRFEAEGWRQRKDGSRLWASVVIDPIRDDDGGLIGFTKITRDLTERKLAQEALEHSREQFFQSQKLKAIGQLTGGVAHDFNNILAAILSSLTIAKRRLLAGEDASNFLDNASRAAERGATLTQRMLAFARKQDLKLEAVDLVSSVREMVELLQRTIGPGISIQLNFPSCLPHVVADNSQLELAIINLVVNARDAMPKGGTITIAAEVSERLNDNDQFVHLSVSDIGEGMDQDTLARAVDPFFTTKGVGKGTGLGLSMVHGMVEQCGGDLSIQSAVDKGTTIDIRLKVADRMPERATIDPVRSPSQPKSLRVLAVDDDAIVLLNTVTLLEDMGHYVFEASSAASALAALEKERVDLPITDYAMPGMTGSELIEQARCRHPGIKVILASGYADFPDRAMHDVPKLPKPFRDEELATAIAAVTG